ncbi:MAG: FG-GAP-like repeat-containing protein, partial [Salinivirgaceae bacterium]|nr:FG-GAP-like repeat-containing protein [Salinivirgaceae bacterium]
MYLHYFKTRLIGFKIILFVSGLFFLIAPKTAVAQTIVTYDEKDINLSSNLTVTNFSFNCIARDQVVMSPGFSFKAQNGLYLSAKADNKEIHDLDEEYLSSEAQPTTTPNTGFDVGAIGGAFDVSPSGAATYNVPIAVSPGTMGMQPNVSVVYNSQGGNGLLGVGWEIAGFSAITRVPANIYTDGASGGVNLNLNDKFALDGNRLLLKTGTYGVSNSTYATQNETFVTVTATGTAGNGPQYFTVTTKDGKTLYYGNSTDSRALPVGKTTPYMWRLNKAMDANGNYMTFTYKNVNGESVIDRIDYTGNATAGLSTYNSLEFYYDLKTDKNTLYVGGGSVAKDLLLREIRAYSGSTIAMKYNFYYTITNFTHLNKITQTAADGSQLNPTIINWGISNTSPITQIITVSPDGMTSTNNKDKNWSSGDLNGDGFDDLISYWSDNDYTHFHIFKAKLNSDGTTTFQSPSIPDYIYDISTTYIKNIDFLGFTSMFDGSSFIHNLNGDGEPDFVVPQLNRVEDDDVEWCNIEFWVLNESIGFGQPINMSNTEIPAYSISDINSDGIDDIIFVEHCQTNGLYQGKIRYGGTQLEQSWLDFDLQLTNEPKKLIVSDFNNDGLNDIFIMCSNTYYIYKNIGGSTGLASFELQASNLSFNSEGQFSTVRQGDFNGDGLPDLILNGDCNANWYWAINNGNWGFTISSLSSITAIEESFTTKNDSRDNCLITDFNNDGKSDVVIIESDYHKETNIWGEEWGEFDQFIVTWYKSTGTTLETYNTFTSNDENYSFIKSTVQGDFNGDGRTDIINLGSNLLSSGAVDNNFRLYNANNSDNDDNLAIAITDGMCNKTSINYQPITQGGTSFYTKGTACTYPLYDIQAPLFCVKNVTVPDGIGGTSVNSYAYAKAKMHVTGLGFMGFETVTSSNNLTNIKNITVTELNTTYFTPQKVTQTSQYSTSSPFTKVESTFEVVWSTGVIFNKLTSTVNYDYLKNINSTTSYLYDASGNVTQQQTTFSDGSWTKNDMSDFLLGKPKNITVTSKHKDDATNFVTNEKYTYNTTGNVLTQIKNQGTNFAVTTTNSNYNGVGLPGRSVTSASGVETYTTDYTYDATKRFPLTETTVFGTRSLAYEPIFGQVTSEIDQTGGQPLETTYTYDVWGRPTGSTSPTGVNTNTTYNWSSGGTVPNALFYVYTTQTGLPWSKTYSDGLGRTLREETIGFNGTSIYKSNSFNSKGQVTQTTSVKGGVTQTVDLSYDNYGRPTDESYSTDKTVTFSYSGLTTTTITNNKTETQTFDCLGNLVSLQEPITGHTITYLYKSNGKPVSITSAGVTSIMGYDAVGHQTSLTDPDAGTSYYSYDAYGRITYQKDGNNNEFWMVYDNLSRLTTKTDQEGNVVSYSYVTSGNGKHQLLQESFGTTWKTYTYDAYNRVTQTTEHVDANVADQTYIYSYNSRNQVTQMVYPSGITVTNTYDSYGNLSGVKKDGSTIWTLTADNGLEYNFTMGNGTSTNNKYDASGLPDQFYTSRSSVKIQGYDYTFNSATGNLTSRADMRTGYTNLTESFTYDNLDRLTGATFGPLTQNYSFEATGNITSKYDMGDYYYNSSKPHQVTEIAYAPIGLVKQDINYTTFNKVSSITQGTTTNYSISYGSNEQRKKMVLTATGGTTTTYYFGRNEVEIKGTLTRQLSYISAGNGLAAIHVKRSDGTDTLYYVHKDHLGSIMALTNDKNTTVAMQNFDAWGRYRNPNTWAYSTQRITVINRGYTGHEHLTACNLINMNGRVYDPLLGMFLSPDNFVQSPTSTQNFNRYAYCLNNPLSYTDPDGEFWHIVIGAAIGGVINLAMNWDNIDNFGEGLAAFGVGAGAGALTAATGGAAAGTFMASTGAALGAAAIGGAAVGGTNNIIGQTGNGVGLGDVNWGQVGLSSAIGGVAGLASYGAGTWASNNLANPAIGAMRINSPMFAQGINGMIGGAAGGYAGGFTAGFLFSGGDINAGFQGGWSGLKSGAMIGGGAGLGSGYLYAKQNNLSIWNGKSLTPKYDFTLDAYGDNITMYRGTTGSEGNGGPLFMTDNPDYAATYVQNGGRVVSVTIPRSTYMQMQYNQHIQTFQGVHGGSYGFEYQIHPSVA